MRFKRDLIVWHWVGVVVILALTSLWHFAYSWAPNVVSAAIFPVNQSAWENVKLFLFPSILFYIVEYIGIGRKFRNYLFAHGLTLIIMPALMLALFYFYRTGIGLEPNLIADMIVIFISICIGLYIGYRITVYKRKVGSPAIAIIIALVLAAGYAFLTFKPLEKPLFLDPNTNGYGIEGYDDSSYGTEYTPHRTVRPTPSQ